MCRSYPSLVLALFLVLGLKAQRPTATFISESLVRLDLDGIRVFADAPTDPVAAGIGVDDVVLFATEPASPPAGGRTFMPSMTGELLERRTERLGEKTAIYVHPVVTPIGEAPHYSYLVQWNGRRIYFTGETTDTKELLALTDLDLVFATPAIVAEVAKVGKEIGGRMVVIYHNTGKLEEVSVPCYRCKVMAPAVGETIQLFR
ncbi:MAG: hypothetical protein JNM91_12480 [Flavobacteriales bacterium]|nr:hypothetical protein [Flavobacteriales bacterium]